MIISRNLLTSLRNDRNAQVPSETKCSRRAIVADEHSREAWSRKLLAFYVVAELLKPVTRANACSMLERKIIIDTPRVTRRLMIDSRAGLALDTENDA